MEAMDVKAFDDLKQEHKVLLLEDMGQLVFSLEYYEHRILLFSFRSLFVEVFKNIETGEVERIHAVSLAGLDKYLAQITLGNLVREAYIL